MNLLFLGVALITCLIKMYTVWGFEIVFHKIIEEDWKKF